MKRTVVVAVAVLLVVWTLPTSATVLADESAVAASSAVAPDESPVDAAPSTVANEPPLADAGLDQQVQQGAWVLLDGGGSTDPDGEITAYEWSIEAPNGSTVAPRCGTCERTEFRATEVGVYAVTLTVTDDDGASSSDTLYVTVVEGESGPSVSLSGPGDLPVGTAGTFTADLTPGAAPIEQVRWRVDGTPVANRTVAPDQSRATFERSFPSPGAIDVSVTVVDAEGRTATDSLTLQVRSTGEPPGDGLSVSIQGPDEVDHNESASFEAEVSGAAGPVTYDWSNVDDSDGGSAIRTFEEPAGSEVLLTVTARGADGETATATKEVRVADPLPSISISGPRFVERGERAAFEVQVLGERHPLAWYTWEPTDGAFDPRGRTYTRTFDEELGETINVTVTAHTPKGTVERTRLVRVSRTRGEPNESTAAPQVGPIEATERTADDGRSYWAFEAEVAHWGSEDVTVEWQFADGTTKQTTHGGLNGTTASTVEVMFTYDPSEDPQDQRDGPRQRGLPVTVTVTDGSGDTDTAEDVFVVTEYPEDSSLLDVSVFPDRSVRAGTPVTFDISPALSGEIDFGDGRTRRFGRDPADGGRGTVEVTHTFDRRGTYTVEVWTDDGRHETVTMEIQEGTYTVYKYETSDREYEDTIAKEEPRGDGWERMGVHEVHWNYTDKKRIFKSGNAPARIVDSRNWKRVGTETRVEKQTYVIVATEKPAPGWTLAEKNVDQDRKRVEYTFPDGSTAWGWETVHYHRYERTMTRTVTYEEWQYAERTVTYEWTRRINITVVKFSLSKPDPEYYNWGTLEKETFNCGNEDAPKYEQACIPDYNPPGDSPNGPGPQ